MITFGNRYACLAAGLLIIVGANTFNHVLADDKPAVKLDKFVPAFAAVDKDADKRISLDEFLVNRNPADVAKRDFKLFDLNENGFLTLEEFATVPFMIEGDERGPLHDPMSALLDQVIMELDKTFGKWNEHPEVEIPSQRFVQALNARFGTQNVRMDPRTADTDANGKVSRDEARRFFEIQLGIRRGDGRMMRSPSGLIFNYMLHLLVDADWNDQIDREEYRTKGFFTQKPDEEFDAANTNKDGNIDADEWEHYRLRGVMDPVWEFRQIDANLDAFLSPEEIVTGTVAWKKKVAENVFPGFDLNGDGKLSLAEYRMSPHGNMVLPWDWMISDTDGDGTLSFTEFQFDPKAFPPSNRFQFPLLRYIYFHRLDQNGDGKLDPKEYAYKRKVPDEFFVMNEDGTGWKSLFLFEGHSACGSIAVSPDGKSIAFDSWPGIQQQGSAIFVMNIDEGKPRQICSGMMPTWSNDGQFLACSRNEPVSGVWMLDLASDGHEHLGNGWGAQWSPDGQRIAFTQGRELKSFDFATETFQTILSADANPYQQIYWNMKWSPDGKRICFKGLKSDATQEVASVNTAGADSEIKIHYSGKDHVNADFAWHPKGDRIVFARFCPEAGFTQLYEFNPLKDDPPMLLKGQDQTRNNSDADWTPDGKRLIVVSGDF